jgi:hypothetical protein
MNDWQQEAGFAVTVCDLEGTIVSMNKKACAVFQKYGGGALVGKNLLDCHPEPAREKLARMLRAPSVNAYTIEKNGAKKFIYQAPWFKDGAFAGLVELSFELPESVPHFVRGQ